MSVERQSIEQRAFIRRPIKPLAFKREIPPVVDSVIGHWTEAHGLGARIEYQDGFQNAYMEAVRDGYTPVIVANHDSQSNAVSLVKPAYILRGAANEVLPEDKRIQGFLLPLAASLDSGRQGKFAKIAYDGAKPTMETYGIIPVLTTTKHDKENRDMIANPEQFMSDMREGIKEGYAVAVLAEGTVDGGRRDLNGKRNGMQELVDISLKTPYTLLKRYRKTEAIFIPVGIEGGTQVHDPAGRIPLPHTKAFLAGFGFGSADMVIVRMGMPIKSDGPEIGEMVHAHNWEEVNNQVGKAIASLIPEEMRGVYR